MSFVIKKKDSFFWDIKIKLPENGKYEEQTLNLEFKKIKNSEMKKILSDKEASDLEFCKKIILGWKDVQDETGLEIKFDSESLENFLDIVGVSKQIVTQYIEALSGIAEKN